MERSPKGSDGSASAALLEDIVAANRILAMEGVLDAYGHVSIRHPSAPDRYLLSRSLAPASVTGGDILEYDLDSNPIDDKGQSSVLERFIHGEIYKRRSDVNAAIHSHSPAVIPFSVTQHPLRPVYQGPRFSMGACQCGTSATHLTQMRRPCWSGTALSATPSPQNSATNLSSSCATMAMSSLGRMC